MAWAVAGKHGLEHRDDSDEALVGCEAGERAPQRNASECKSGEESVASRMASVSDQQRLARDA